MNDNELKYKISKLRLLIKSGYGLTNKPIPPKRMKILENKLIQLETSLNSGL